MNYSLLGIIFNILSTISFPDSVDELDNEMDIKDEDEEGDLFPLFSSWPWLLCSLFVGAFHYFWAWWKVIFFPFPWLMSFILFTCWGSLCVFWHPFFRLLIWVISSFIIFCPTSSLELTTGKLTFASCWSVAETQHHPKFVTLFTVLKIYS